MASRILSVMLGVVMAPVFGQTPAPVQAGDRAPNLSWTKIVASASGLGGPQSLVGQTTVLFFLPPVSQNEQTLSRWNKLVEQFADQPVNFIWIANEREESLDPFLKTHPVRGWLINDRSKQSYDAYGIDGAAGVLIDPHGVIAGFTFLSPEPNQIEAVLENRSIAIQGDPTDAQMKSFFDGKAVRLEAEPFRSPSPPRKPDIPPSDEVHISSSQANGTISSVGPDYWVQRGFDLRAILAKASGTSPSRIDLPASLDNGTRYDFVLVPPREEDEQTINRQVREAIEKHFHVTITPAIRPVDVYVMSAVEGKTPPPRKPEDESFAGSRTISSSWQTIKVPADKGRSREAVEEASRQAMATAELRGMTALSTSMDDFRRALEDGLHRPIVDDTKLTGLYDFKTQGEAQTTQEFLNMLRDQLGLVLTPTQRSIEVTVVRPVE